MTAALVETNFTSLGKSGSYEGFLAMWGVGNSPALTLGTDYATGARYDTTSINANVIYGWQLPAANNGVRGYLQLSFGNYDGGSPTTPLTPKKINAVTALAVVVAFQVVGDPVSLLNEFWASTTAHATGSVTDKVEEVGCFPHVVQYTIDYMNGCSQIGTFTDPGGRSWTVARDMNPTPHFTMFRPTNGADVQGTIYWKEMLAYLVAQGVLTGQEYFNGMAFGPEPVAGKGAVNLSLTGNYA